MNANQLTINSQDREITIDVDTSEAPMCKEEMAKKLGKQVLDFFLTENPELNFLPDNFQETMWKIGEYFLRKKEMFSLTELLSISGLEDFVSESDLQKYLRRKELINDKNQLLGKGLQWFKVIVGYSWNIENQTYDELRKIVVTKQGLLALIPLLDDPKVILTENK